MRRRDWRRASVVAPERLYTDRGTVRRDCDDRDLLPGAEAFARVLFVYMRASFRSNRRFWRCIVWGLLTEEYGSLLVLRCGVEGKARLVEMKCSLRPGVTSLLHVRCGDQVEYGRFLTNA